MQLDVMTACFSSLFYCAMSASNSLTSSNLENRDREDDTASGASRVSASSAVAAGVWHEGAPHPIGCPNLAGGRHAGDVAQRLCRHGRELCPKAEDWTVTGCGSVQAQWALGMLRAKSPEETGTSEFIKLVMAITST